MDVILVDRMALPVRMDERMVSDGAEVNHHRSYVLHGVPPHQVKTTTKPMATIRGALDVSTRMVTGYGGAHVGWTDALPSLD